MDKWTLGQLSVSLVATNQSGSLLSEQHCAILPVLCM